MKKAQVEMFGLIIFVIILVIFMGMFLVINTNKEIPRQQEEKKVYGDTFTDAAIKTILNTDTDCDKKMKDIVKDCATSNKIKCNVENTIVDSCNYSKLFLERNLPEIMKGYEYELILKSKISNAITNTIEEKVIINIKSENCSNRRYSTNTQVYSLWPMEGSIIISLSLC